MDKVAAFCIGNAIGITVLFGGVLLSESRKMKEAESSMHAAASTSFVAPINNAGRKSIESTSVQNGAAASERSRDVASGESTDAAPGQQSQVVTNQNGEVAAGHNGQVASEKENDSMFKSPKVRAVENSSRAPNVVASQDLPAGHVLIDSDLIVSGLTSKSERIRLTSKMVGKTLSTAVARGSSLNQGLVQN